ncbi:hypothetical protein [Luteococcus sp.]|uniref:hypothetical protein n=1 Tax=Luteococcus sp. TaxID=1969402 RepID=UPI0037358BAC
MARHSRQRAPQRRSRRLYPLLVLLALVVALLVFFAWAINQIGNREPSVVPAAQQCAVRVGNVGDQLTLEQSGSAAIIAAEALHRELPPRAVSIALATAMQESDLRNIDYGDRDSVGLFQQRPSQGWGSVEQIMDPWYSTGKFYDHLVQVDGWESGDINDVAQKVQRSGVPDGYRKHVERARAWGSALTGHSPAAVRCIDRGKASPQAGDTVELLQRALGSTVQVTPAQAMVTITSNDETSLWAATQLAMMTTRTSGVTAVQVGAMTWTSQSTHLGSWEGTATPKPTKAVLTLRA